MNFLSLYMTLIQIGIKYSTDIWESRFQILCFGLLDSMLSSIFGLISLEKFYTSEIVTFIGIGGIAVVLRSIGKLGIYQFIFGLLGIFIILYSKLDLLEWLLIWLFFRLCSSSRILGFGPTWIYFILGIFSYVNASSSHFHPEKLDKLLRIENSELSNVSFGYFSALSDSHS